MIEKNNLWAFGTGKYSVLGLCTNAHQLLLALVGGVDKVFDGEAIVLVADGDTHAAYVKAKGTMWSWGEGQCGKLRHCDREPSQRPARLGKEVYGGSPAVMVACGRAHTLVLTARGCVWSCGWGYYSQLGHSDTADKLVLTLVVEQQLRGAQIVNGGSRWKSQHDSGGRGESVDLGVGQVRKTGHQQ